MKSDSLCCQSIRAWSILLEWDRKRAFQRFLFSSIYVPLRDADIIERAKGELYICIIEWIDIDEKSGSSEVDKFFLNHCLRCPMGHMQAVFFVSRFSGLSIS